MDSTAKISANINQFKAWFCIKGLSRRKVMMKTSAVCAPGRAMQHSRAKHLTQWSWSPPAVAEWTPNFLTHRAKSPHFEQPEPVVLALRCCRIVSLALSNVNFTHGIRWHTRKGEVMLGRHFFSWRSQEIKGKVNCFNDRCVHSLIGEFLSEGGVDDFSQWSIQPINCPQTMSFRGPRSVEWGIYPCSLVLIQTTIGFNR